MPIRPDYEDSWESLTGRPEDALDALCFTVRKLVQRPGLLDRLHKRPAARMFYIGRTSDDLPGRKAAHGADSIYPLYESSSVKSATAIEGALINEFQNHELCDNISPHGGGGSTPGLLQIVYVAVWWA